MPQPIQSTTSTVRPIQTVESTVRRLDPAEVAAALGGEPIGSNLSAGGPAVMCSVQAAAFVRDRSTASSPVNRQIKISDADWELLKALAIELSRPGYSVTAVQVASILLSLALDAVEPGSERYDPVLAKRLAEKIASQT